MSPSQLLGRLSFLLGCNWLRRVLVLCGCLLLAIVTGTSGCRQNARPAMPAFDILLADSSTMLSSKAIPEGNPVVLVYFSPDCEHCQHETANILRKMDSLKDVRFYFITTDPFERLRVFRQYYHLSKYRNVVLGEDYRFSFFNKLKPAGTPITFIYDRSKRLKAVISGETEIGKIISLLKIFAP